MAYGGAILNHPLPCGNGNLGGITAVTLSVRSRSRKLPLIVQLDARHPEGALPPPPDQQGTASSEGLITPSVIYLFVGIGLSGFLSYTHTWFYGWFSSGIALLADFVGGLSLLMGLTRRDRWRRTSLPFARRLLHLSLWIVPILLYMRFSPCAHLLRASASHDRVFERCFLEAYVLWFAWLLLGGRLYAQLLGIGWYRLKIYNVFTIGK